MNSVVSTAATKFMTMDIDNLYLNTLMDRCEYMRLPVKLIPPKIMGLYSLEPMITDGHIYIEVHKGIYGLPQAGKLANDLLKKRLGEHGYHQC